MRICLHHTSPAQTILRLPETIHRQFIEWARQHGHSPATGVDAYIDLQSESDLEDASHILGLPEETDVRAELRKTLLALSRKRDIITLFPPVYICTTSSRNVYRYSLMLVRVKDCVEWTARVWRRLDYQGALTGREYGPFAQHTQLARIAVEDQLNSGRPNYVEP